MKCLKLPPSSNLNKKKAALEILLQYAHDFNKNLKTLCSKLVTNNNVDHKSYDVRQHVFTYLALLKLCTDELIDCKLQIMQLTTQINKFATLDQTGPKHAKRGLIHFLFNFLFGDPNISAELNAIKNNMAILEENQDIHQKADTKDILFCKSNLCGNWHQSILP